MTFKKKTSRKKASGKKKPEDPFDPEQNLRNCTIVTQLTYPTDPSRKLITDDIQGVIDKHIDQIKSYAWIIHDRDIVHDEDMDYYERRANELGPTHPLYPYYKGFKLGDIKPAHCHIVINWKNGKLRKGIAAWFGCENTCIRAGVLGEKYSTYNPSIVLYLLHLNRKEKGVYKREELYCNPLLAAEIDQVIEEYELSDMIKNSKSLDLILEDVKSGKTAKEVYEDPNVSFQTFVKNEKAIRSAETLFRLYDAKPTEYLLNIYIQGESGTGKTSIAKQLAKYMYPKERSPYFVAGGNKVALQNYAGEKVIIWNDVTPSIMHSIAPTGDVQDMLDPYQQEKKAYNIKYGSVILIQEVNIFTSTMNYKDFFKALIKSEVESDSENEKKEVVQIYRRVPFCLNVRRDSLEMLINKGEWCLDPAQWLEYDTITIARINMSKVMQNVPNERLGEVIGVILQCICLIINEFKNKTAKRKAVTDYEILRQAENISINKDTLKYIDEKEWNTMVQDENYRREALSQQIVEEDSIAGMKALHEMAQTYAYDPDTDWFIF